MKNMSGLDNAERDLSHQVSRAYAMTPRDEPPAAIDAAILAQARAGAKKAAGDGLGVLGSVHAQSDRRRFLWGPPMATAALLVLSVSLVMWMEREQPEVLTVSGPVAQEPEKSREQPSLEPVPLQAGRAPKADGVSAASRQRDDGASARSGASDVPAMAEAMTSPAPQFAESRKSANREAPVVTAETAASPSPVPAAPSTSAPSAAPALPSPYAPSTELSAAIASAERAGPDLPSGSPQRSASSQTARSAAAPAAAERRSLRAAESAGNFAASRDAKQQESPQAWLVRIAELRKQGRTREAEESLAEFRKRYPDYPIPAADFETMKPSH